MAASQGEIYRLLTEFNGKLGEIGATVKALDGKVAAMADDLHHSEDKSDQSRARVHTRLDEQLTRLTNVEADLGDLRHKVADMETVTVEVTTLRNKAEGAGTLGRVLIRVGIGIVTLAGWAVGIYTYYTGRPPP